MLRDDCFSTAPAPPSDLLSQRSLWVIYARAVENLCIFLCKSRKSRFKISNTIIIHLVPTVWLHLFVSIRSHVSKCKRHLSPEDTGLRSIQDHVTVTWRRPARYSPPPPIIPSVSWVLQHTTEAMNETSIHSFTHSICPWRLPQVVTTSPRMPFNNSRQAVRTSNFHLSFSYRYGKFFYYNPCLFKKRRHFFFFFLKRAQLILDFWGCYRSIFESLKNQINDISAHILFLFYAFIIIIETTEKL